jgi:RNA polymerase sigma-70 factor (ECF subfamily)
MAMRVDPDQDLVTALCEREPTAAEALVTAYRDRAYRLAARITGNQQDAEEAVQDAFWSVVRKIDTFRGDSAFGSWVYRIVSNAAYGKIRRRPKAFVDMALDEGLPPFHEGGHEGLISDWSSGIDDPAVQTELRSALSSAVAELPAHYRAVMVLHDVEGLSMAEVADALAISVPTAKSRAHRARLSLRKRLSMFIAMAGGSLQETLLPRSRTSSANSCHGRGRTTVSVQVLALLRGAQTLRREPSENPTPPTQEETHRLLEPTFSACPPLRCGGT